MTVGTFVQPNNTTQDPTTYKGSIDASFAALVGIARQFAPHQQASANMTVVVDAGSVLNGTTLTSMAQQSTGNITTPSVHPRIDRIVVDTTTGVVSVITGAEANSPSAPALTTGKAPVAQVLLQTSSTVITNSMIVDERVLATNTNTRQFTVPSFPNSSARVAQRSNIVMPSISGSNIYVGAVDGMGFKVTLGGGGSISQGIFTQMTPAAPSLAGTTGYAARVSTLTISGANTGNILNSYLRMEAADAAYYANKTCSFQIAVSHNFTPGASYQIAVSYANTADNFSNLTVGPVSGNTVVATSTGTLLKFENFSVGACANGLQIAISASLTGAVSGNYFDFTEWSLDIGSVCPIFQAISYEDELAWCQRYCYAITASGNSVHLGIGVAQTTLVALLTPTLPVTPRLPLGYAGNSGSNMVSMYTYTGNAIGTFNGVSAIQRGVSAVGIGVAISGATFTAGQPVYGLLNTGTSLLFTGGEFF